jgi:hypothetical protein
MYFRHQHVSQVLTSSLFRWVDVGGVLGMTDRGSATKDALKTLTKKFNIDIVVCRD